MSKFTPSPQEVALVNQIFAQADLQKIGVVTGDAAVKIFGGTKLPASVLAEVWNIADDDNKGVLTRKDVAVAIRLLGHAQRGERVTEALIHKQGPVPSIEGLNAPLGQQITGVPSTKSPPPGALAGLPPLTPQDKAKFMKLFLGCGPTNGILPGDKARDVFVKSKLPVDKLSQIWGLADTKNRGALDLADFTIAMYLIQASMSGALQAIPSILPPYLHEQAKSSPDSVISHTTGGSGSLSPTFGGFPNRPVSTIQPQYTGTGMLQPQMTGQRPAPPLPARTASIPAFPLAPQSTGQAQHWDITPQEKASSDQFFDTLDTLRKGYIEGDVAVPFMLQSKLSDDVLAQIWDLADLNNDGHLTRDGFAVAMHLIQGKLTGKEVPSTLPSTLIPPSMRSQAAPPQPPQPHVPEAIRDLLWDDIPSASTTVAQPPAPTFPPPRATTTSPQPTPKPTSNMFGANDPFASSSSPFSAPPAAQYAHPDLLGDDDDVGTTSPPLQDKSAEIGNVQNQLHSTNRAVETVKQEREDMEKKLADQAAQLSSLQTQLTGAKAAYETETRLLASLRERYSTQAADIQKTRQELIHAESDLSAVRVEKAEVEGAVLRDKEEVRELQRKMTEVGTDVEGLKAQMEKLKKDAKQQKGLLAIAKKQLATREAERARVAKEAEEAQVDADATNKELEETEAAIAKLAEAPVALPERVASPSNESITGFAAAQPLPGSPPESITSVVGSPVSARSTNPFERLALGTGTPRSESPFLPFTASAVLPTPPIGAAPSSEAPAATDPFGFEDAFGADQPQSEAPKTETHDPTLLDASPFGSQPDSAADVLSPGTDHFVTPPTTATLQAPAAESDEPSASSVPQSAVSSAVEGQMPGHFPSSAVPKEDKEDTDLNAELKELDIEESDSDSDDDDEPLTSVKAKLNHEVPDVVPSSQTSSAFDDSFGIASSQITETAASTNHTPVQVPESTFLASSEAPAVPPTTSPFGAPTSNGNPVTSTNSESSEPVAGASDFDEAFGKLSGSGTSASQFSHVSNFTFDSAFEDDFDFAAAKAASVEPAATNGITPAPVSVPTSATTAFPPPPTQAAKSEGFDAVFMSPPSTEASTLAPPSMPTPQASVPGPTPVSFDDAFGTSAPNGAAAAPAPAPPMQPSTSNGSFGITFDDAFGGHTGDALALGDAFAPKQPPPVSIESQAATQGPTPFPTTSTPASPTRETASSSLSRRSMSPPPRQTSPAPRASTRSRPGTATSEKEKEKPTRHSKLSIRLPFGRKKAKHDPLPSNLSQSHVVEEPPANDATPAAEDDIEAVKTLCGMGFSRTQAVTALEQYDYDVQRAINSLLGTRA